MPYLINDDLPGQRPYVPEGTDLGGFSRSGWREDEDQSAPPLPSDEPELSATEPNQPDPAAGEVATPEPPTDKPKAPAKKSQPAAPSVGQTPKEQQ